MKRFILIDKRKGPNLNTNTARLESVLPRIGDYSTWSEDELRSEIARRRLACSVSVSGVFTDDAARKARLVEILTGNDQLSSELKKIAARYIRRLEAHDAALATHESRHDDDKETKP